MKQRDLIILSQLKKTSKGLTCHDFPKGVHYKDAILHLRQQGHNILMLMEKDKQMDREIGRYFYLGYDKTKVETPKAVKESKRNKAIQLALEGQKSDNKEVRLFASRIYNILK
jgi:hypothetical protein